MKNHYFQMDDRALWSELRSGSLIALEVIYRRYYSLLLNYGMKCTPDDDMVRDCIQELFVKLAKSSNLSDTEYPRSYLLKSLRNMINDKSTSARSQVECFSFNDEIFRILWMMILLKRFLETVMRIFGKEGTCPGTFSTYLSTKAYPLSSVYKGVIS